MTKYQVTVQMDNGAQSIVPSGPHVPGEGFPGWEADSPEEAWQKAKPTFEKQPRPFGGNPDIVIVTGHGDDSDDVDIIIDFLMKHHKVLDYHTGQVLQREMAPEIPPDITMEFAPTKRRKKAKHGGHHRPAPREGGDRR